MQKRAGKPFASAGDVQYLDKYSFKYDIRLENHLLIDTILVTLRNLHTVGISCSQAAFSQLTFDRYCIAFDFNLSFCEQVSLPR